MLPRGTLLLHSHQSTTEVCGAVGMNQADRDRGAWPQCTYRYAEHYFWRPEEFLKTERSAEASAASDRPKIDIFCEYTRR